MLRRVLAGTLLRLRLIASPEIERVGQVCNKGICLAWWPKLVPINGWHHEDRASWAVGARHRARLNPSPKSVVATAIHL